MKKSFIRSFRPLIIFFFLVVLGLGGLVAGSFTSNSVIAYADERYQELQIFTKVLNLVQQYYVETVDTKKLIYGAIKGMLAELDPHTNFMPPEIYKEFESETSGEFGGLGIEITLQNDILTIISPIEDTPAWAAGIQAGDKVIDIDGFSTKGLSLAEAAQRLRGKNGTTVRLNIYRDGFEKPKEFPITRGVVKVKSVKYTDLGDGYGYVRLTSFIENTAPELEKMLKLHTGNSPNKEVRGIILDLRRNPGGLLDQAVKISDMFLESGVIVSTIGRNQKEKEVIYAKKDGTNPNYPLIVLVNEYSASASEIVAGALQDNKRALVMGQTSFGKGSVQSVVKLGDGSGLKLTVARYYTPSGKSIQSEGIKPDVVIDDVDNEAFKKAVIKRDVRREQDISGHLLGTKETEDKAKSEGDPSAWWNQKDKSNKKLSPRDKILAEDFQVLQAYNYLKAWKVMRNFGLADSSAASAPNAAAQPAQTSPAKSGAEQPTAVKPSKNEVLKMKKDAPKKILVPPGKGAPAPKSGAQPVAPSPAPTAKP